MKVLLVAVNYDPEPTGIAPYVSGLAKALLAGGHEPRVLTGVPHYPQWRNDTGFSGLRRHEVIDGVPVTRVRHVIPAGGIGLGRVMLEVTFGLQAMFTRWGRPDVVLTVSPPLVASAAVLARARLGRHRPATVLWSQDLYTRGMVELGNGSGRWKARLAKMIEGSVYRAADGVIAIGGRFRDFAVSELGVPADQVDVHLNWSHAHTDPDADGAAFRRAQGWGSRPVVLHAGSIGNKQGLDVVVDAAKLAEQAGSPVLFVLCGDGSERARLQERAGSCANIAFVDPLPTQEFAQALFAADLLLVHEKPGVAEMAIPSKLTTYFSAAKPVLAAVYPLGNTAALVDAAAAGEVVAPGDPQVLLDEANALMSDPDKARACGEHARVYASAHMATDTAVAGIIEYLTTVAQARGLLPATTAPTTRPQPDEAALNQSVAGQAGKSIAGQGAAGQGVDHSAEPTAESVPTTDQKAASTAP